MGKQISVWFAKKIASKWISLKSMHMNITKLAHFSIVSTALTQLLYTLTWRTTKNDISVIPPLCAKFALHFSRQREYYRNISYKHIKSFTVINVKNTFRQAINILWNYRVFYLKLPFFLADSGIRKLCYFRLYYSI